MSPLTVLTPITARAGVDPLPRPRLILRAAALGVSSCSSVDQASLQSHVVAAISIPAGVSIQSPSDCPHHCASALPLHQTTPPAPHLFSTPPSIKAMPSATPTPSRVLLPLSCTGERRIPSLKSQTRRMNEATENARAGLEKRKKRNWFGL